MLRMKIKVICTTSMYFGDIMILRQILEAFDKCYFWLIMLVLMIENN